MPYLVTYMPLLRCADAVDCLLGATLAYIPLDSELIDVQAWLLHGFNIAIGLGHGLSSGWRWLPTLLLQ